MVAGLRYANILFIGIFAGGGLFGTYGLQAVLRTFEPREVIEIAGLLSPRIERLLPPAGGLATLTALALLVADRDLDTAWLLTAVGAAVGILLVIGTIVFHFPINRRFQRHSLEAIPDDEYRVLFRRWARVGTANAVGGLVAFVVLAAAAVWD